MILAATILPGLPPYGPMPTAFPASWGRLGREGLVVEFETEGAKLVGNFEPGSGGLRLAGRHPNGRDGIVLSDGDLWIVSADLELTADRLLPGLNALAETRNPDGWIFDRQGLALVRFSPEGILWHTRRLSWDGFDQIHVGDTKITGMAWSPVDDDWYPFEVDLGSGRAKGGSFSEEDPEGWEKLHLV